MRYERMKCVYCGAECEWLMCNACIIKTYEYQIKISELFMETAQSEEWKNPLLEEHSRKHIEELKQIIKELKRTF